LPEGPYPLGASSGSTSFSWVAIQHGPNEKTGSLNILDWHKKTNQAYSLPGRPGFAFATDKPGVFVVGCERQVGLYSTHDGAWEVLVDGLESGVDGTIINDAVLFEDFLIFGAKDLEFKTKKAGLYLFRSSDRQLFQLRCDQICSNGKAVVRISQSSIRLYDIDSPTRKVVAYDIDTTEGRIVETQTVLDLTNDPAVPDGMIMTPNQKSLIISFYNPNPAPHGETRQYSIATGELEKVWQTPGSPQNTCPQLLAFDDACYLVITTAVEHMRSERRAEAVEAGSLFYSKVDIDPAEVGSSQYAPIFKSC
jgi:sugar lactone lactonase YvrE